MEMTPPRSRLRAPEDGECGAPSSWTCIHHGVARAHKNHLASHDLAHLGFPRGMSHQNAFARVVALGQDAPPAGHSKAPAVRPHRTEPSFRSLRRPSLQAQSTGHCVPICSSELIQSCRMFSWVPPHSCPPLAVCASRPVPGVASETAVRSDEESNAASASRSELCACSARVRFQRMEDCACPNFAECQYSPFRPRENRAK